MQILRILLDSQDKKNQLLRTLEYDKNKTAALYSKHKILNILDLFKLSVAKFMYSFYNGGWIT